MWKCRSRALTRGMVPHGLSVPLVFVCVLTLLVACGGESNSVAPSSPAPQHDSAEAVAARQSEPQSPRSEPTATPQARSTPTPTPPRPAAAPRMDSQPISAGPTPTSSSPPPDSSQVVAVSYAYNPPSSLDELIFLSEVIARVTLLGVERHIMVDFRGSYLPALKFRFSVVEYVKGSGDSEISAEVPLELEYVLTDRLRAEAIADHMHEVRDQTYEDREAIVFLVPSREGEYIWSEGSSAMYRFTGPHEFPMYTHQYTITSDYNRAWLPSTGGGGASGASGATDPTELTYMTGPPSGQAQGASGAVSSTAPSISLSEINRQVEMYDDLVYEGRDVTGYLQCVEDSFRHRAEIEARPIEPAVIDREILSGQPAGHRLWPVPDERSGDPYYAKWWMEGPDSDLFEMRMTDDDDDPTTGYAWEEVTTRPVPAGTYTIFYKSQAPPWIPCDYNPGLNYHRYEGSITVTAPAGTLHEARFDPVDIGAAIGSDGNNGILDPASFTLEGAGDVEISHIDWQTGIVEIEFDPHSATGFANHHVDFIALDGTTALRLDFDDAVEVERDGTRALAWSVCDQPWEDGDLLMLRMSTSTSDLTDVTKDSPCSPPQNLTATSTHDSVTLAWDQPEDPTVTGHRILRRPSQQETFTQFDVDGAATTTYVDTTDIQPASNYIYRVHAVNDAGLSEMARVAITTLAPPPQNLVATSTHDSVTLTWSAPDDTAVTGYRIFRRQPGQDTSVQFEVSGAATTSYVDTSNVQASTKYIYRVHTVYSAGLSDVARVTVTTSGTP